MHEACAFIYLPQFLVSITLKRQRDRMAASALTSQQEGPTKARLWSLHVLPVSVGVVSPGSSFLPQSINMHVYSKNGQRWECECEWSSISLWMDGFKCIGLRWMDGWNNTYMLGVMHVHHLALLTTKTSH